MNYFETIRQALDSSIEEICIHKQLSKEDAYVEIKGFLNKMSEQWYSKEQPKIEYGDPLCRFAYLYCHVASNANLFERVISDSQEIKTLIRDKKHKEDSLKILAFGGGPGTELLSFTKYIFRYYHQGPPLHLQYSVWDRVNEWAESWEQIKNTILSYQKEHFGSYIDHRIAVSSNFLGYDFVDHSSYANLSSMFKQDVFALNYVLSEVYSNDIMSSFQQTLKIVARHANDGALFILVDRNETGLIDKAKTIFEEIGLKIIRVNKGQTNMDYDEQSSALIEYSSKINHRPRVQWNAFWIIAQKSTDSEPDVASMPSSVKYV